MDEREEMVLVIRRELFDRLGAFQGLCFDVERYLPSLHAPQNNFFVPRSEAENDPALKQIIPYVLLVHQGRVLHYTRGGRGGEKRLVAKGSIGIGGHVNDGDGHSAGMDAATYYAAVRRETGEELVLQTGFSDRIAALLNDDSNEVGRVHLGVVHVFHLETDQVFAGEEVIEDPVFLSPSELAVCHENLESWSAICAAHLEQLMAG